MYWQCEKCVEALPFHNMHGDELRYMGSNLNTGERLFELYKKCEKFTFEPFLATDYNSSDFEADIDPKNNFCNDINTHCKYYTEERFRSNSISINGLSFIHFNARSLNSNF